jgi:hypothetical protein
MSNANPKKVIIQLPREKPASNDCLPHAAMNLGASGGGVRPAGRMVARLIIEEQLGNWVFYRMDAHGGFAGDTWHESRQDALRQAQREFGIDPADYSAEEPPRSAKQVSDGEEPTR